VRRFSNLLQRQGDGFVEGKGATLNEGGSEGLLPKDRLSIRRQALALLTDMRVRLMERPDAGPSIRRAEHLSNGVPLAAPGDNGGDVDETVRDLWGGVHPVEGADGFGQPRARLRLVAAQVSQIAEIA
jgi:hypothetical protein